MSWKELQRLEEDERRAAAVETITGDLLEFLQNLNGLETGDTAEAFGDTPDESPEEGDEPRVEVTRVEGFKLLLDNLLVDLVNGDLHVETAHELTMLWSLIKDVEKYSND